jgi:DtxR family transcriptional regulator, Mn-dependent transcriptional regulator
MLSQAIEDYLKTIYKLQGNGAASTSDIARSLNVSAASVTNMVKRLSQMGLAEYTSYRGASLTEAGQKIALEIIRHHRLLELYLKEVMGYPWERLHEEAEHLEHHISEEFEDKIEELLGFPTHDPHGHPIPSRDGIVPDVSAIPLAAAQVGARVVIHHLADDDPSLLHHLEERGLMPRTPIEVVQRSPFEGPLKVRIGDEEQIVGHLVACSVFVLQE